MIYEFNGFKPVIDESAFVHPQAVITGNVIIGKRVYIGPGAVLRGDWGQIIVHEGCNIQENCTLHMFPGLTVILHPLAHIGHGAIIHGATIGHNTLIGMNSVVMDHVVIGRECIIGALTFIPEGTVIPDRKLVAGNPGKIIKDVTKEMITWKTRGTELYQTLTTEMQHHWKPCEPLRQPEQNRQVQSEIYKTWKASQHENH